jgi:hypothetical protein
MTSKPLASSRRISTIARSNSEGSNAFNPAAALAASTTSKWLTRNTMQIIARTSA